MNLLQKNFQLSNSHGLYALGANNWLLQTQQFANKNKDMKLSLAGVIILKTIEHRPIALHWNFSYVWNAMEYSQTQYVEKN